MRYIYTSLITLVCALVCQNSFCQIELQGSIIDAETGKALFSCTVAEKGKPNGTNSDFDGNFNLNVKSLPTTLSISSIGYILKEVEVLTADQTLIIRLDPNSVVLKGAEVVGSRISDKQKQEALTVETMDVIAIKDAPSGNFYEGLGNLKDVDLTSASLGFKIINTRGFNSTSPVRSLQLIDGVDNQSPGLNFSLGNFLGASDLDVMRVNIVAGASSAFYGPGAFNGVVDMRTKDPFLFPGVSLMIKKGERALFERAIRVAQPIANKDGVEKFGFKMNLFVMEAQDWEATNYEPIFGSPHDETNPFGYDAVNIYGDEPIAGNNDATDDPFGKTGLGVFYRNGYQEVDLVDYSTDNLKFNTGLYYKLNDSLQVSYNFNYSTGSTVYQGDNRYRLEDIEFFQHQVELKEEGKWFIRGYTTSEDAGNTYDIVTTAIRLQEASGSTADWNTRFLTSWQNSFTDEVQDQSTYSDIFAEVQASGLTGEEQLALFSELLQDWYVDDFDYFNGLYQQNVEVVNQTNSTFIDPFYQPGTARFDELFNSIKGRTFTEGGSRFYDKSKLYHVQGEYKLDSDFADFTFGGNVRFYRPDSQGTIFEDTLAYTYQRDDLGNFILDEFGDRITTDSTRVEITNREFGLFGGAEKVFLEDRLKANVTLRVDKNQNFDYLFSPAASLVFSKNKNNTFRLTFSSAIRNPTLADQYLFYDVGRAILLGNISGRFEEGQDSLFTVDSFQDYRNSTSLLEGLEKLDYFNVDRIRPEKVRTIEGGYRGTLWEKIYVDLGGYYSVYTDFIGFNLGINGKFDETNGFPDGGLQVFRVAANARELVTTSGVSIGLNYYFNKFTLNGNYSFNQLLSGEDDPIIPAFNTPKNKFNLGFSGRDIAVRKTDKAFGFGINYKWIQGFLFEGSPQFTGNVPTYDLMDAQINLYVPEIQCTFKLGGSNIFGIRPFFDDSLSGFSEKWNAAKDNRNIQVYGGPLVGRIFYASILFEWK